MSTITDAPLLSFIVLSYNYEKYIGQTIQSILDQTVQNFEVIVVDDASTDKSCAIVESFADPRIRLFRNETNIGGTRSYNKAVELARGEWLVNLDADDWIAPDKSAIQLAALAANPDVDIIGTHVSYFDAEGRPHPNIAALDNYTNRSWDPNLVENWIGENRLCRSSTMVRRSAHLEIGLDDPDMTRAPDYELWTRALRKGYRFLVVPQKLTSTRVHSRGVTHGNVLEAFLERTWVNLYNLMPLIEKVSAWPSYEQLVTTVAADTNISSLDAKQRHRLFAALLLQINCNNYSDFKKYLDTSDPATENIGRRLLAISTAPKNHLSDIQLYIEARDFWYKIATSPLWLRFLRKLPFARRARDIYLRYRA